MDQNYLELLENIRDVMAEIESLKDGLRPMLNSPAEYLEQMEDIRDTLAEIAALQEDMQ